MVLDGYCHLGPKIKRANHEDYFLWCFKLYGIILKYLCWNSPVEITVERKLTLYITQSPGERLKSCYSNIWILKINSFKTETLTVVIKDLCTDCPLSTPAFGQN